MNLYADLTTDLVHSMGGEADLHIDVGYPCVMNNEKLTANAMQQLSEYMGETNVSETELRMGAEDFGYYAQQIPACFYRLGTMNKSKGIIAGVHTPVFNIDEDAIEIGMGMMAWMGASVKIN